MKGRICGVVITHVNFSRNSKVPSIILYFLPRMQPDLRIKSQSTTTHRPSTAIVENFFLRFASRVCEGRRKNNEMYSLSPYVVYIHIILYMVVVKVLLALNEFCDLSYRHTRTRATLRFDFSHCILVSSFARRYSINQYIHNTYIYILTFRPLPRRIHHPRILCIRPVSVGAAAAAVETTIRRTPGVEQSHNCRSAHNIIVCKPLYAYNIYLCIRYVQ